LRLRLPASAAVQALTAVALALWLRAQIISKMERILGVPLRPKKK
jgi:hypothetical protein